MDVPVDSNKIQRFVHRQATMDEEDRALRRMALSNKSVTCNDGSPAG